LSPEEKEFLVKLERDNQTLFQKIKEQNYDIQQKIILLQNNVKELEKINYDALKFAGIVLGKDSVLFVLKNKFGRIFKKILRK